LLRKSIARTLIDISVPLENTIPADPPLYRPKITYVDHQASVPQVLSLFPGVTPQELPDGEGWAIETVEVMTHNGTHLDAPYHFASTMNHGDDFGFKAVEKPVHPHDIHATILRQLGIDNTRLTYRHSGRDFRLTDVAGNVIEEILV
jgi:hypothetical protein